MKLVRIAVVVALAGITAIISGCSYGGVATAGDKAVVLRNDMLLMGMLRQAYVCSVSENGLSGCRAQENP